MTYVNISCEVAGNVATLTLNRPEKLNALTNQMVEDTITALDVLAEDPRVDIIVLTGAGRAFCAGFDITEGDAVAERTQEWWRQHFRLIFEGLNRLWSMPQPIIAKVRGACVGGGFNLTLMCDLVYASEGSFFGEPEVKFGGASHNPILPMILSPRHYCELVLTGRTLDAERAAALGIINEVVSPDALDTRVDQIARHMGLLPPGTLQRNKAQAHAMFVAMGFNKMWEPFGQHTASRYYRREVNTLFSEKVRTEGMTAALRWQKDRFDAVGAFPR
jgi:enoyl-CoA hydratase